ncbi:hypothetical protein [Ferruginibacter sp. SUN106]|uniref:hypothetical protein n=1 Tax=Ferruginibacter sp. SUN106 TaxID=2978348 RepID=UPI003D35BEEB
MAKQRSIIKLEGTMDDITFMKTVDGYVARKNNSVSGNRIKSDPAFQRTRENNAEFKKAAAAATVLRKAFRNQMQYAKDGRVISRLLKEMIKVLHADATSTRGMRNVMDGETELLQGFQFNLNAVLDSTLFAHYQSSIDRATGNTVVDIPAFIPANDIVGPDGITHFKLIAAASEVNFEKAEFTIVSADSGILPWNATQVAASQLVNALPAGSSHPLFLVFGIQFFQVVNGTEYPLKNGAFNPLSIINVNGI